jgi:PKD repeat protein
VYSVAGTYTVSLEVTGPGGTNTKTLASYVKVVAPAAADATPLGAPSSVVATASGSTTINLKWNASVGAAVTMTATATGHAATGFGQVLGQGHRNRGLQRGGGKGHRQRAQVDVRDDDTRRGFAHLAATYSGDALNTPSASGGVGQSVNWPSPTPGTSTNVALATNGAVATGSSTYSAAFLPATAIDNRRTGAKWGTGVGWHDATGDLFPDWLQIKFNGLKTIDNVVYSLQDNHNSDGEPSSTLAFSHYGLTDFAVQGYKGSAWVTLATVANNRLVKRTAMFVKLPAPGS